MKRAQTTDEALRPEAARPTTTARAAKRAADETRPGLGRAAHEAHRTNATCALHDGAPTSARRLRPRRRLQETTAKATDQREGEACVSENVTYVRGASKTTAAQRPHLSATSLKLDPGTGLAGPREPFARRLGRRANDETNAISKARDRSGPALYKTRSRTRATRPHQRTTRPRHQTIGRRRGLDDNGERSEPSSFSVVGR